MLSVAFIVPSWFYFFKPYRNQPLTQLYLATLLEDKFDDKIGVSVIDLRGIAEDELHFHVPEFDMYLHSVTTPDYNETVSLVERLRKWYPKAKHVAGGTHVNLFSSECIEVFDSIVLGEGEGSIVQVVSDMMENSLKPIYRHESPPVDLNAFPYPSRHYLPKTAIVETDLFGKQYLDLIATTAMFSRGCPFKCAFCANVGRGPTRVKKGSLIQEEIGYLRREFGIQALSLKDENCVPVDPKVAVPFLEAMGLSGVLWRGQTRVGAKPEIIKLAREAGCVEVALGVESASPQVLKLVRKGITVGQTKKFIQTCKENDLLVKLCLIMGLPGEPPDIVKVTRAFLEETQPDFVNLATFCPYPGSEIYDRHEYFGIKYINKDWSRYAHLLSRFSEDEGLGLPFEYCPDTKWGKAFTREQIKQNVEELQQYLREREMIF